MLLRNPLTLSVLCEGGEGATLREVLKHTTVEHVTMIEIDEVMVNVSRQFLPEWSSCMDVAGSTPSCFEDPRVTLHFADAVVWFIDKFEDNAAIDTHQKYDVIIMDAL
jgi:spermidine synthase